jgi:hypothetical protein
VPRGAGAAARQGGRGSIRLAFAVLIHDVFPLRESYEIQEMRAAAVALSPV